MAQIKTIRPNMALKENEIKETHSGKPLLFSINFVKKNGELVFIPRAVAAGFRFSLSDNRMRGVLPVNNQGNPMGHVTPVHIDGFKIIFYQD